MIQAIIKWSLKNRVLVLLITGILVAAGIQAVVTTPIDALPDLSDVQVIIKTNYPGQAPQVVEDQVTYPLTTAMLAVPGATSVRGYSFFGDSFVYIIFEDGTDLFDIERIEFGRLDLAEEDVLDLTGAERRLGSHGSQGLVWVGRSL